MTRFARAKGSKSSNERKPEESTSWSEMRNSMLSKNSNQKEEKPIPSFPSEPVKVTANKTEWASLGDTLSESISLIKQHMSKKNNSVNTEKYQGKKRKKSVENELNQTMNGVPKNVKKKNDESVLNKSVSEVDESEKKKMKKTKNVDIDSDHKDVNSELKVKKKEKKRKLIEGGADSEAVLPKKKAKVQKTENAGSKKSEQKGENKNSQQHQKKGMKSKNFRKDNENRGFSKNGKQFEGGNKFKNKHYQERNSAVEELIINGQKIPITKFQGFYVTLEDAERLKKLRSEMMEEGIPKAKLEAAIKLERRRAEKALSRLKKSVCFHCRGHGHLLSNCPNLLEKENTGTGICYKCGSTEHSAAECKVVRGTNYQFAECFICKEQGHIARQCPDNPRGLYPQGGACRECGDVTHLRKDCPKVQTQKAEEVVTVGVRRDIDLECLDEEIAIRERQNSKKKVKRSSAIKF